MSVSMAVLADDPSAATAFGSTAQSIAVDINTQEKIPLASVPYAGQGVSFHDVSYEVGGCTEKSRKVILHSVRY